MYKRITPAWNVAVVVLVGSRDARLAQTGERALRINKSVDGTCNMCPRCVSTRPYLQTILLLSQALPWAMFAVLTPPGAETLARPDKQQYSTYRSPSSLPASAPSPWACPSEKTRK